ncbi:MAG: hypothetical protein IH623_09895 [Verrucomicrobia bacterium]|nr:hypothetical protein [Verrucomicrobiota bacterium]
MKDWFTVDKEGLAKVLGRRDKAFAVMELVQNAWDAEGASRVEVTIKPESPGRTLLIVEDNSPEGFADLTHAYTLFKESPKKADPLKRGRFDAGEKLVLAICDSARICTTKGTLIFDKKGRRESPHRQDAGSRITCLLRMTKGEMEEALGWTRKLLPPPGILTRVNNVALETRQPTATLAARLPTEKSNAAGFLRRVERNTEVKLYEPMPGEAAMLYEMGIPIVETADKWHYDVAQKIPLTLDREGVAPSFLRDVRLAVFNHVHEQLRAEEMNSPWVEQVVAEKDCKPAAIQTYLNRRFSEKRVAYDPSDPEANKLAVSKGYVVVTGSMMSSGAWKNSKTAKAIVPAGQVTPSPQPYSPDGPPLKLEKEVTSPMRKVEQHAIGVAREILQREITVTFANDPAWPFAGTYGPGRLTFNVGRLGRKWFDLETNRVEIEKLLLHEFAHEFASDHLSHEYHESICNIAAKWLDAVRNRRL